MLDKRGQSLYNFTGTAEASSTLPKWEGGVSSNRGPKYGAPEKHSYCRYLKIGPLIYENNPLPPTLTPPHPPDIKYSPVWYILFYWEYLILGGWAGLISGGEDSPNKPAPCSPFTITVYPQDWNRNGI